MWFIIALCLIFILLYFTIKSKSSDYWEKQGVPVAAGREWFFGHYKQVFLVKKHIAHLYAELYNEFPEAPVVGYYQLSYPALVVRDPELIRTILTTDFTNYASNGYPVDKNYDVLAGFNPFFTKGEDWKMSRNHATPVLSTNKLKGYLPSIVKVGDEMVKYLRNSCQKANIDLKDITTMFTTDVMANAICGIENNTFEDRNSFFATITGEITRQLDITVLDNLIYLAVTIIPGLNKIMQLRFATKKLENLLVFLTRQIIRDRTATGKKRNDVYQVMMAFRDGDDKGVFTDEYITSQVFTILLDLFETSSNALMVALFTLAWHPEHQNKLRSEIFDLKLKTKGEYTLEDVEKFKYLDMVFNESLRLYLPISVLSRESTKNCTLAIPGQKHIHITEGTPVIIPIGSIQVDPKYYPEPTKFDPERFSEEEITKRPKFTFMPFGEGPKKCLGMRIATLQVKVAIMSILEHFILKPSAKTTYPLDIDPKTFLFSRPTRGAWVHFEEIK
ncbi:cytochrome P450 6j1-like [Cydia pomonella]|uniref:cytochrome P450 6j1-like n=1 Tax=Cydia pomonella TaxID=82600 RepID=UPI002ADE7902|nr:cytochrome P450 6j1-like [Cydia pomonella]